MVENELFNDSIYRDRASEYRLSLRNSLRKEKSIYLLEKTMLSLNSNFVDINYYLPRPNSVFDALEISRSYKDFSAAFLYLSNFLNETKRKINSLNNISKDYLKLLNKDLKVLKAEVKKTDIKLNSHFNKVKVYNLFQDKDVFFKKDLFDYKSKVKIKDSLISSYKKDGISSALQDSSELPISCIEIVEEESFGGSNLEQINVSKDTSLIYRDNKVFNYIVAKNIYDENGRKNFLDVFSLTLVINFNGYQDLNNLFIYTASSLPINIDVNNIYYNLDETWIKLANVSQLDLLNRKQMFFTRISTNKIKIKLLQSKFIDTSLVKSEDFVLNNFYNKSYLKYQSKIPNERTQHIYDISIADIKPYLNTYRGYGLYTESNKLALINPLSLNIVYNLLFEDTNTYIEKEALVVLYGNKDVYSINKENDIGTLRYSNIIALPDDSLQQKEILIFNSLKEAPLKLFPYVNASSNLELQDIFKLYLITESENLLSIGDDYSISFDGGDIFYTDKTKLLSELYKEVKLKIANNCIVKLSSNFSLNNSYVVKYKLDNDFYLDDQLSISCKNRQIVLNKKLHDSVGYIQPRFIFRNFSKTKESSIIQEYKILVEENLKEKDYYIESEEILELTKRGTSNVVQ